MRWYEIRERADNLRALNFIIGGRGIGKTYGTLDYIINSGKIFIYLRNTEIQLQESSTEFGNPFKRWNRDHDRNIVIKSERKHCMIYDFTAEDQPRLIGYAAALSTFSNLRGVDLSDVDLVIFDEFIERRTLAFQQFEAFANFYETVSRNRELLGEDPLQVFLLSNAQKLDNPILAGYGIIPIIEQMMKTGRQEYVSDNLFIELPHGEVSEAKRATVNYRLTEGTDYYNETINNLFAHDSFAEIKKRPISEYTPICALDDMYIWRHKSGNDYYVCRTSSNKVPVYSSKDSLSAFLRRYRIPFGVAAAEHKIFFSEFLIKSKFLSYL